MRGIKLSHGVYFVEYKGVTIRINQNLICELSPILLSSLEWDLRTEPPEKWEYMTEQDIISLGNNMLSKIEDTVSSFNKIILE